MRTIILIAFLALISGPVCAASPAIYTIASVDSETQITTTETLTANATANKVWQITTGSNFGIGTNLKAAGFPSALPGASSTSYPDIGAVQRQESTTAGGQCSTGN